VNKSLWQLTISTYGPSVVDQTFLFISENAFLCREILQGCPDSTEIDTFRCSNSYGYYDADTFTFPVTRYFFRGFSFCETITFFERT